MQSVDVLFYGFRHLNEGWSQKKKYMLSLSACPTDLGNSLAFLKQQIRKLKLLWFLIMQQLLLISLKITTWRQKCIHLPATLPSCYCFNILASVFKVSSSFPFSLPSTCSCPALLLQDSFFCIRHSAVRGVSVRMWDLENPSYYLLWCEYAKVIYIQCICKHFWHAIGIIFSLKLSLESSSTRSPATLKVCICCNEILKSRIGPNHKKSSNNN